MPLDIARTLAAATIVLAGVAPLPADAASIRLWPAVDVAVPGTSLAEEPSLAGIVLEDRLTPFVIRNILGAAVCRGTLQLRVRRSSATGRLDFAYRIRNTRGSTTITGIIATGFSGRAVRIGYRTDGVGTEAPTRAYRYPPPGGTVVTGGMELDCSRHEESRFLEIRSDATSSESGGRVTVESWAGPVTVDAPRPPPL